MIDTNLILIVVISFVLSLLLTWIEIPILKRQGIGQSIREEGPESHLDKSGTPTMGGLSIIAAVLIVSAVSAGFAIEIWIILAGFILFGILGFTDDFNKLMKKQNLGLTPIQKLAVQIVFGLILSFILYYKLGSSIFIPGFKLSVDFGYFYIPFITFVIVAMTNAVNLTDGLDGLAASVTSLVALFFVLFGSLGIAVGSATESGRIFFAAILGACLGFLVFNKNPAKLFMGDTGSLALGGGITVAAVMMDATFLLPIVGFVYLIETLSVAIQVIYFKISGGKRIFKMAPLHHHFELSGLSEKSTVILFVGITIVFCVIGWFLC